MPKAKPTIINQKRQQELIIINKILAFLVVILAFTSGILLTKQESLLKKADEPVVEKVEQYPLPAYNGVIVPTPANSPLTKLLKIARYEREMDKVKSIDKNDLLTLVWAGQGEITDWGERTAPSYKSKFPLELKMLVKNVNGVAPGWYKMDSTSQQIIPIIEQEMTVDEMDAPVVLVLTQQENIEVNQQMVWQESGEVSQNILLMAKELNLSVFLTPSITPQSSFLWTMTVAHPETE